MEQQGAADVAYGQCCVNPFVSLKKGKGTWPKSLSYNILLVQSPHFWDHDSNFR